MWRVQTQNDHQAFAVLVERWEEPIFNLCVRMTGDSHSSEDLSQETFTRLYQKRRTYRPTAKFSTYLWRIAMNLCYDELRRRNRRSETLLVENADETDIPLTESIAPDFSPGIQVAEKEENACVRNALLKLSETYRSVVVLRHYEDLKCREIAEVLNIPEGTVYSRLAEGYDRLARILEPELKFPESAGNESSIYSQFKHSPSIL